MKVVVGTLTNASANIASMHTQKQKNVFIKQTWKRQLKTT